MTRVCVIEDHAATREVVRLVLEDAGYAVVEADNGLSGLALLQGSVEPLVVVIDHRLPRMDGCDLLELVAIDEMLRQRHVYVFMTGDPRRAVDECGEALDELAVPLLPKPFGIDELLEAVQDAEQRLASRADRSPDRSD
jgi:CheY-like chemotaxis protein